jgi:hypothetical protein
LKNSNTSPVARRLAAFLPALVRILLAGALLLVSVFPAHAIQPAFIKGTVFNTFNSLLVTGATIYTANGVSTAASNGAFVLRVPPGIYTIVATAPASNANLLSGIPATPGNIAVVNIGITPASTPLGYVEGYIVRSSDGEGIQGALITTDLGGATISSGRDGSFRLPSPSGTANLVVSADGFSSKQVENYPVYPYITTNISIDLNPAPAAQTAIKGIVKDACTGIRINDAVITSNSGEIATSADGFYSIETPLGLSTIIVSADGYQFASQTFFLGPFATKTYDFSLSPTINGFGSVRGSITSSETGEPIAGVRIEGDTGVVSSSRQDGTYTLYTSICTTTLYASRSGYLPVLIPVTVGKGIVTTRNFSMTPLGKISGTIRDSRLDYGIKAAIVTLQEVPGVSCTSSSDGSYMFSDIQPGNYTITVTHPCYLSAERAAVVVSGSETADQDIPMEASATGTVHGKVRVFLTNKPISSVAVSTSYGARVETDANGFYALELPACTTDITIGAPGYLSVNRKNINPAADAALELNAMLIPWPFHFLARPESYIYEDLHGQSR